MNSWMTVNAMSRDLRNFRTGVFAQNVRNVSFT